MGNCLAPKSKEEAVVGDTVNKYTSNFEARKSLDVERGLTVIQREFLLAQSKADAELAAIANRIVDTGAISTASVHTEQGKKGRNQDAMIAWEEFAQRDDTTFAAVFDGHGPFGHLVAKRVRDSLPTKIADQYATAVEEKKGEGEVLKFWAEIFKKTCAEMDAELRTHAMIDTFCSGTTAVAAVRQGNDLLVANIGDSRAILATTSEEGALEAIQLSVDLKPGLPGEAERIKSQKGRVFALADEPEVVRVWLPHEDSPGLAMARAFGDMCLKDFGVISEPEITHHALGTRDKFVVLASDGVWDVMSNEEVVNFVASVPNRKVAAEKLIAKACKTWKTKFPYTKTDDCAVVVLYLDGLGTEGTTLSHIKLAEVTNTGTVVEPANTEEGYASTSSIGTPGVTDESYDGELIARADSVLNLKALDRVADELAPDYGSVDSLGTRANSVIGLPRKL